MEGMLQRNGGLRLTAGTAGFFKGRKPSFWEYIRRLFKALFSEEDGIGVIEIVLILVVLIGLVIIFKEQINELLTDIFKQIDTLSESVY